MKPENESWNGYALIRKNAYGKKGRYKNGALEVVYPLKWKAVSAMRRVSNCKLVKVKVVKP